MGERERRGGVKVRSCSCTSPTDCEAVERAKSSVRAGDRGLATPTPGWPGGKAGLGARLLCWPPLPHSLSLSLSLPPSLPHPPPPPLSPSLTHCPTCLSASSTSLGGTQPWWCRHARPTHTNALGTHTQACTRLVKLNRPWLWPIQLA